MSKATKGTSTLFPQEKDGATPLKRPSKSLDGEEGEKKDP